MKTIKLVAIFLLIGIMLGLVAGCASGSVSGATISNNITTNGTASAASFADTYKNTISTARTETWKVIANSKAAGASIAVIDNGTIVFSEGFGMADREASAPVTNETMFNIGSISKVFVTTAIMQLVDEHKVGLDNKVTEYIPEFSMADERYKDITVRNLLNHTSGLPGSHYGNMLGYKYNSTVLRDLIADLKTAHLKYAPGEMANYCNDGFTLAEIIVERVSGKSYADFLQERIFQPLSMGHSGRSVGEQNNKSIAMIYAADTGKRQPPEVMSVLGAGGLAMTAEDLCRFGDSFAPQSKHILSDASLAEMKKAQQSAFSQYVSGDPFLPFGLSWDVTSIPEFQAQGIQTLAKGGDTSCYSAYLVTVPDRRVSVAVTVSQHTPLATEAALTILKALFEEKGLMKAEGKTVTKPAATEPIPEEWLAKEGLWISGGGLAKLNFDKAQGTATLSSVKGDVETPLVTLTYNNGALSDQDGTRYRIIEVGGTSYFISEQQGTGIILKRAIQSPAQQN
jgi:CubicO group peptidase (beta-lactamase class C family)